MSETTKNEAARNSMQHHNHLAAAEMGEEGNYNMIDGVINNTKKPSILEHLRQYKPQPPERGGKPEKSTEKEGLC